MAENYEQEKAVYSAKLERQISTINRILNIESCGLIDMTVEENLQKIRKKAEFLKRKLDKNEFEIAIVGLEKAGKSTFANALMGNDILPAKEARCTYTSTRICSGSDTATVHFFTTDEFNKKFREQLREMKIPNADSYNYESINLAQYQNLFDKLDSDIRERYQSTANEDVTMCINYRTTINQCIAIGKKDFSGNDELSSNELKKYIEDPRYALAVKSISIYSSRIKKIPNAVIYDVPGFDSPTAIHKEQTVEQMRNADAIILIASAYKPSFTGPIVDLFQKNSDYDGIKFGSKMFVFANKCDMAQELNKNIEIIQNDLERFRIMERSHFDRIVAGSAQGSLEKEKVLNTNIAYKVLQEKGLDDGVDKIFNLLTIYNETERFEILKRRIDKLQSDVIEIFKELQDKYKDTPTSFALNKAGEIMLDIASKKESIVKALEKYRSEIKTENNLPNRPISDAVIEKVVSQITIDKFGVTDEEYTYAKNRVGMIGQNESPEKVDNYIRDTKEQVIYKTFTDGTVSVADQKHKDCDDKIVEIIMNGLDIASSNANSNQIKKNIYDFINSQKDAYDGRGYYRSLIERFSRDLFEILIINPLGSQDRWNKFESDAPNFQALAMYDTNKKKDTDFENQPLYSKLLFQTEQVGGTYETSQDYKDILAKIGNVVQYLPTGPIPKLLAKAFLDPNTTENVKKFVNNNMRNMDEKSITNRLEVMTKQIKEDMSLNKKAYDRYFLGKRDKDKDAIISEINQDVVILHDVLNDVVINAISIEKAFLALEFGNIANIIAAINGEAFREFVKNNAALIRASEYASLEAEQQQILTRQSILGDIKNLLDQMNNYQPQNIVN